MLGDITEEASLVDAMSGVDALVVVTSAVPKIRVLSLVKLLVKKVLLRRKNPGRPKFYWRPQGTPEEVDWEGQKRQFDAAKAAGVKHVVLVGSMGGTQEDNFLNTIGDGKDGESPGNILAWKRKAEMYLVDSGLVHTIIHPGGLLDDAGGKRQLRIGVDDELLQNTYRSVPRADVAAVCVHALTSDKFANRSFDLASFPEGEGSVTTDLDALIEDIGERNCDYSKTPNLI